jgi:hypothetical protein
VPMRARLVQAACFIDGQLRQFLIHEALLGWDRVGEIEGAGWAGVSPAAYASLHGDVSLMLTWCCVVLF